MQPQRFLLEDFVELGTGFDFLDLRGAGVTINGHELVPSRERDNSFYNSTIYHRIFMFFFNPVTLTGICVSACTIATGGAILINWILAMQAK
jgi:hypothetical protein